MEFVVTIYCLHNNLVHASMHIQHICCWFSTSIQLSSKFKISHITSTSCMHRQTGFYVYLCLKRQHWSLFQCGVPLGFSRICVKGWVGSISYLSKGTDYIQPILSRGLGYKQLILCPPDTENPLIYQSVKLLQYKVGPFFGHEYIIYVVILAKFLYKIQPNINLFSQNKWIQQDVLYSFSLSTMQCLVIFVGLYIFVGLMGKNMLQPNN